MFDSVVAVAFVPSSLYNFQMLLEDLSGARSGALLGAAWHFGPFNEGGPALCEYNLPISWDSYSHLLAQFAAIKLETHELDDGDDAYDRLDLGQPVVLAVDSFYLPYRPAYLKVHSARTLIATQIDRAEEKVQIADVWMPSYSGNISLADLERARSSSVPSDFEREPLYAGIPLQRRWWTLALLGEPLITRAGGPAYAIALLTAQAAGRPDRTSTPETLEQFRETVVTALTLPLAQSRVTRRAAALWLRGEIGLRAYLVTFLRLASEMLHDALLSAEIASWSKHLKELAHARDVLIKSVVFGDPRYAELTDITLASAVRRERRFLDLLDEVYGNEHAGRSETRSTSS